MPVPPPHTSSISSKLPLDVLERICSVALIDSTTSAPSLDRHGDAGSGLPLLVLDSQWHRACSRVLYREIVLEDDDELLLLAAAEPDNDIAACSLPDPSRGSRSLARIVQQLRAIQTSDVCASSVKLLTIVPGREAWRYLPDCSRELSTDTLPETAQDAGSSSPKLELVRPEALDDVALHGLVLNLPNLEGLRWTPARPMPCIVAEALATRQHFKSISFGAGNVPEIGVSEVGIQRWNAATFPVLPLSRLTSVTLSMLSQEGVRLLQGVMPGLVACETLVIEDTPFLDDALLSAITEGAGHLRNLAIRRMTGTQITNKGIASLLENSPSLEELELTELEGRLTKKCWAEVQSYPPTFKSLRVVFNEASCSMHSYVPGIAYEIVELRSDHSWAIDHLESISAFVENVPSLEVLEIARLVPKDAQMPFNHDAIPINPLLTPKSIPKGLTGQILKHAKTLRCLDLSFWEIPLEAAKAILESGGSLSKLSIMLDAPFAKLMTLNSAFAVAQKLQVLQVCIPPRHTPLLGEDSATAITLIKGNGASRSAAGFIMRRASNAGVSAADDSGIAVSPARGRQGSLSAPNVPKEAIPLTRDIKKFVKRAIHLQSLGWIGRGGVGVWDIPRSDGGKESKITFRPINEVLSDQEPLTAVDQLLPDGSEAVRRGAPLLRRTRGTTASSYTSMSSLASFAESSSSNTTPGGSIFRDGFAVLSNSPTSSKANFEVPGMPVTPIARGFAFGTNRKSRSKSMPQDVDLEQTPTRTRTGKSNSISIPSNARQDEKNVIRVIHGGGWVSRKTFRNSGSSSSKMNAPIADEPVEQPKKSSRGGRRDRKNKTDSQLSIEVPQPLTEQNLRSVPVTSSRVEFPDLASPVVASREKEDVVITKGNKGKGSKRH